MKTKLTVRPFGLAVKKSEAALITKCLVEIEKRDGMIRPQSVLEAARPKDSLLHHFFEWDDGVAAESYRLIQARRLVQSVQVQYTDAANKKTELMRAFVNITQPSDEDEEEAPATERGYISLNRAAKNRFYADQVVQSAYAFLLSWQKRYAYLKEFLPVSEAIAEVGSKLKKSKSSQSSQGQ